MFFFFFFQAEDGIRDFCLSRGLGDVYKRQDYSHSTTFMQSFPSYVINNEQGTAGRNSADVLKLSETATANYRWALNDDHSFNFMLGQEAMDYQSSGFQVVTKGQSSDLLTNISSGTRASSWDDTTSAYSYLSFFLRGEYNYKDLYLSLIHI